MLYLDTSSLVKLYVGEEGADEVKALTEGASLVATSIVAYAEGRAALARQHREKRLTAAEYAEVKKIFDGDWQNYIIVPLNKTVSRQAGHLTEKHGLMGFDAIHLASYLFFAEKAEDLVRFSSFDDHLKKACYKEMSTRGR